MLTIEQILSELAEVEINLTQGTRLKVRLGKECCDTGRSTVSVFVISSKAPKKGTLIARGAVWGGNRDLWLKAV